MADFSSSITLIDASNISTSEKQHFWFLGDSISGYSAGAYITNTNIESYKQQKTGGHLLATSNGIEIGHDGVGYATVSENGLAVAKGGIRGGSSSSGNGFVYLSTENYGSSISLDTNRTDWRQIIGSQFGVTSDGKLYASGAKISGVLTVDPGSNIYTKDESNGLINNIKIGSENLVDGSYNLNKFSIDNATYGTVSVTDDYLTYTRLSGSPTTRYGVYYNIDVEANTDYVLSFDVSGISGNVFACSIGQIDPTGKNNWSGCAGYEQVTIDGRHVRIFNTTTATKIRLYLSMKYTDGATNTVRISKLKLEKGNKVTDWSPSINEYSNSLVEIGGKNLLRNSSWIIPNVNLISRASFAFSSTNWKYEVSEWNATANYDVPTFPTRIQGSGGTDDTPLIIGGAASRLTVPIVQESGQWYTISIYVKNLASNDIKIHANGAPANTKISIAPNEAKRVVISWQGNGQSNLQINVVTANIGDAVDIVLWRPKIEYGNKVTQWSYASEDNDGSSGVQLLKGTSNYKLYSGASLIQTPAFYRSGTYNDTGHFGDYDLEDSPVACTKGFKLISKSATATIGMAQPNIPFKKGWYTMSAWVKGTSGDKAYLQAWYNSSLISKYPYNAPYRTLTGAWQKLSLSVYVGEDSVCAGGYVYCNGAVGHEFYVTGLKLERGLVATDWCVATSDVDYDGRNLVVDSAKGVGQNITTYAGLEYDFTEHIVQGEMYTVTAEIVADANVKSVAFFHSGGSYSFQDITRLANGGHATWAELSQGTNTVTMVGVGTAEMASQTSRLGYGFLRIYLSSQTTGGNTSRTGSAQINWVKVERGIKPTAWNTTGYDTEQARKTATSYITQINDAGIFISPANQSPVENSEGNSVKINGDGLYIYKDGIQQAYFTGTAAAIGTIGKGRAIIQNDGLYIYDYVNSNQRNVAYFGNTARIGKTGTDKRNVYVTDSAVQIRNNTTVLAEYGTSISLYNPTKTTKAVEITSTGATFSGNVKATSLSTGTKTASTTGKGTYIASDGAIYVGDGSTNKFTVTATGAVTASDITATHGKIGGFELNATDFQCYGTASGVGTSSTGLYRYLVQASPGTNGGNAAWIVQTRASTSDSWVSRSWASYNGSMGATSLTIYDSNKNKAAETTTNGLVLYKAGSKRAAVTANGLDIFGSDGETSIASFGETMRVGKENGNALTVRGTELLLYSEASGKNAIRISSLGESKVEMRTIKQYYEAIGRSQTKNYTISELSKYPAKTKLRVTVSADSNNASGLRWHQSRSVYFEISTSSSPVQQNCTLLFITDSSGTKQGYNVIIKYTGSTKLIQIQAPNYTTANNSVLYFDTVEVQTTSYTPVTEVSGKLYLENNELDDLDSDLFMVIKQDLNWGDVFDTDATVELF